MTATARIEAVAAELARVKDTIEAKMNSIYTAIADEHKSIVNLLTPLSADIARRFEESDHKLTEVQQRLEDESQAVRRKIREYKGDLYPWGCEVWVLADEEKRGEFDPRGERGIFLGYEGEGSISFLRFEDARQGRFRVHSTRDFQTVRNRFPMRELPRRNDSGDPEDLVFTW